MENTKDIIAKKVAYWLPNRLVLWVIVRAFAYTTVHSQPDKTPDQVGYGMLYKSWEFKTKYKIDDNGNSPDTRKYKPNY